MKRLTQALVLASALVLGSVSGAQAATSTEPIELLIPSECHGEDILATGTVRAVENATGVHFTFPHFTAVGVESGDRHIVQGPYTQVQPGSGDVLTTSDTLIIISSAGTRFIAHVTYHFTYVDDELVVEVDLGRSRCVG